MDAHNAARRLFRRCVVCPPVTPVCGACGSGEICNLSTQSCDACPQTSCVKISSTSALPAANGKSQDDNKVNAGAIAGGVVAGVVAIVILVFLVWKFCIKPRRQALEDDPWPPEATSTEKMNGDNFTQRRDARSSVHTIGNRSIADTVISRASNVIQIAYIPGVTNRSAPSTPGLMVPPVPQVPSAHSPGTSSATTPDANHEQFLFMPSDLRGSTYSGVSANDRKSTSSSIVHRTSVAATLYRNNAVVDPLPAQTVIRGKAAVVSVKSSGANSPLDSPTSDAPPVPYLDAERHGFQSVNLKDGNDRPPPSPAFSVSSTYQNGTANTAKAMTARPVRVKKSNRNLTPTSAPSPVSDAKGPATGGNASTVSSMTSGTQNRGFQPTSPSVMDSDTEEEDPSALVRKSLLHTRKSQLSQSTAYTDDPSPFGDQQRIPQSSKSPPKGKPAQASGHKQKGSLSAVIEEATRRASRQPTHGGLGSVKRDNSPFSDAHEVKTVI